MTKAASAAFFYMAGRIRKLLDGLQIDHLLPDLDRLGLNVDTFAQAPEYTVELNSSASRFGRTVKIPYGDRNNLLNLYPRPDRFVGPDLVAKWEFTSTTTKSRTGSALKSPNPFAMVIASSLT